MTRYRVDFDEFVKRARKVHGDKYTYIRDSYTTTKNKVTVICPVHGAWGVIAKDHLRFGCKKCGYKTVSEKKTDTKKEFIEKAKKIHGDKYDYSNLIYKPKGNRIKFTCPIHGEFCQTARNHLIRGCKKCGIEKRASEKISNFENVFFDRVKKIHNNKYDYSKSIYTGKKNYMILTCPIHGDFEQKAGYHLDGHGCSKCSTTGPSNQELEVQQFCKSLPVRVIFNDRTVIKPKEIDILFPDHGIGIEYCGLYWHSDKNGRKRLSHKNKFDLCKNQNIELITLFQDEWQDNSDIVKSIIRYKLGLEQTIVGSRKLDIKYISKKHSDELLNRCHIQGGSQGSYYVGAYYNSELVGSMVFSRPSRQSKYEYELRRFACNGNYPGLANRLFKRFINDYNPSSIVSFSDNRWFTGSVYEKLEFNYDGDVDVDYHYIKGNRRFNKSGFRKSRIKTIHPEVYDDNKSELIMMKEAGYDRIFDCGKKRWVWINNNT